MNLTSIFKKKEVPREKINVLNLQKGDMCYYRGHRSPFTVSDVGVSERGVFYVEIKNTTSPKSYLFTHDFFVYVDNN